MGQTESKTEEYSIQVTPHDEKKGESGIFRSPGCKDGLINSMPTFPLVETVQQLHFVAFEKFKDLPFLGTRTTNQDGSRGDYVYKTYGEIKVQADLAGAGFINAGIAAENADKHRFVAIWAKNREEWVTLDIACGLYGIILLPLYDSLGQDGIEFIFDKTKVETFVVSNDKVDSLVKAKKAGNSKTLKNIVSFDPVTEQQVAAAKEAGLALLFYGDILKQGEKKVDYPKIQKDDIYTLCFTSGTTGVPKGAIISHNNVISNCSCNMTHPEVAKFREGKESLLSFMPLSHIFERTNLTHVISRGFKIGFYQGDPTKISDDLKVMKPTLLPGVPRLFNKFHDVIKHGIEKLEGFKRTLADKAIATKMENLKEDHTRTHKLWDTLVFNKIKDAVGGNVRYCVSGAAPLSAEVADYLKICFQCPVIEGYGSTETCAAAFAQMANFKAGNVGIIFKAYELKFVDVPDMKYTHKDTDENGNSTPRGEICLRGPGIFKGYYKDVEKTKETIDEEGWLHTGDIGVFLPGGILKIIDRKKNIFKLSQGEYVAPDKVENGYLTSKYVSEVFVYGDSFQSSTVVVAVPHKDEILKLGKEKKIEGSFEELCNNADIRKAVLDEMNACGKKADLKGYELATNLHLEPVSFVTLNLTTPTLKLKRDVAKTYYQKILDGLYQKK